MLHFPVVVGNKLLLVERVHRRCWPLYSRRES